MGIRIRRSLTLALVLLLLSFSLAAGAKTVKFLSVWKEDQDNALILRNLTREYQKTHPEFKFEIEVIESSRLQQRIKVLLAADDLPDVFAYSAGTPILELIDARVIVNIEEAFGKLGMKDVIDPAASSLLKRLAHNRGLFALPLGMNIEGIWYNKSVFSNAGLNVPADWTELENVSKQLLARGIQPFATGGKDRWPLSRLVNMYILRKAGLQAMEDAVNNRTGFRNADFMKAAELFQKYAKQGWFGSGYLAMSQGDAVDAFFKGKAAMIYNGSWFLSDLNDPAKNLLGQNVGFFNFPLVKGGAGKEGDYSVNCGNVLCLSGKKYDAATAEWLSFVFSRFGDYSMEKYGVPKGYRITRMPENLGRYTSMIMKEMEKVKGTGLWFEAFFDAKTAQVALDNMQALFVGAIKPEELFDRIQKSLEETKQQPATQAP